MKPSLVKKFFHEPVCLFVLHPKSTSMVVGGTVTSANHTFFLGKLEQAVIQYFVH